MSTMIVISFDNTEEAGKVREAIRSAEKAHYISLDDSAVVVRDEEGKVHVHDELDRGVKVGAVVGGFLGLFIGILFAPIVGAIIGVVGGGLVGASANIGISKKFVKDVQEALQPGTSAIFFVIREGDPTMVMAALRPYKGTVLQTTLDSEAEEELRHILKKRN